MDGNQENFSQQSNTNQQSQPKKSINTQPNNKKPKKKKGTAILVTIVIILVIIAGILAGLVISGADFNFFAEKDETSSSTEEDSKSTKSKKQKNADKDDKEDEEDEQEDKDKKSADGEKIDENKPWVHDANYNDGKTTKTATTLEGTKWNSIDTLVLPYININSDYAKKVNDELKSIYDADYKMYGKTDSQNGYNSEFIAKIDYEYTTSNKVLSLVVREDYGVVNGGLSTNYYTYNFNLDTLDEASMEEVYKECGFSSKQDLEEKINITIENAVKVGDYEDSAAWYKKMYYIDKSKTFNIIVSDSIQKGNVAVKPNVTGVEKKENDEKKDIKDEIKNVEDASDANEVEPEPGPYGDGIEEIKKCLKDANWVENNVMMKQSVFGENITGTQTLNFMKVIGGKYSPMFLIEAYSETDLSSQVFIVSYQGGKVVVKPLTKYPIHMSHGGVVADPNKCVAVVTYMHMGYFSDTLFDLSSGRAKQVFGVGGSDESGAKEYYKVTSSGNVDITESEYKSIYSQMDNYKFYPIGTELTDANIDEYVK